MARPLSHLPSSSSSFARPPLIFLIVIDNVPANSSSSARLGPTRTSPRSSDWNAAA
eukprot:CAMPEP_0206614204 /NCGR_PEP_ID=MMETSP0325_2-20121206/57225_1 /ASSEMBLY_ACC=CAM_ASM_000347 /TAXON_ID=2866 /ORGANISM="Crypthecodinium cohnii, Strain Seligo" /LENGTH=55 /DNA_ID=CAMNT_0054134601 /DNA_START=10 /DNA_END=174 /DNA_ORIENTATION=+